MSQDDHPYQPYGAPYGRQPPPSYGYGPPPAGARGEPNVRGIVALVLNLFSVVSCCNVLGLVGAFLAGQALRAGVAPDKARVYIAWSLVVMVAGILATVVLVLYLGENGYLDD
ncbi:hypothetical protein OUY22_15675 [Nonomuraea sp. MCN248]|uniref:DUF4190 domain-containing protein n=1 Tax=Nonomuraea corallina TaxID=2989783 RepID=A0ABT4SCV0_9ACTN|nr:hypothetical protein [Nonomuraea corallina]MDA0634863.1 hypothetical protein [Nonomuraea corallina]